MVSYASRHCGGSGVRLAQSLMGASKIIVHKMERDRVHVVLNLFGEGVSKPCKTPHAHAHREVVAFHVACRDTGLVRLASDNRYVSPDSLGGTVTAAGFSLWLCGAVELYQHGVVDVRSESPFNRVKVGPMAVCGQLYSISQS